MAAETLWAGRQTKERMLRFYVPGEKRPIRDIARHMIALANRTGDSVAAVVDHIRLVATPGDTPQRLVGVYNTALDHASDRAYTLLLTKGGLWRGTVAGTDGV
jgi:hypothetical protein